MGLLFNLTITLCLILHVTLANQFVITRDQLTSEIMEINYKVSYLMERMEKLEKKTLNLQVNFTSEIYQRIDWLNETVKQMSILTKKNSDQINNIGKCLNVSIKDCKEEDNIPQPKGTTQLVLNQNRCNKSEPSQMFNLSPDTLVYTWKNFNVSNIIRKEDKVLESDIFPITNFGTNAKLKITNVSSDGVNVELHILKIQPLDTWPVKVYSRITFVMKVEDKGKVIDIYIWTVDFNFGNSLEYETFIGQISFLHYQYDNPEHSLIWEIYVETAEMSNQFYPDNGMVKGSICPYGKILEWISAKQIDWISSPYFYTSPKGYRAVVLFYFDNESDTKWLYIYPHILPGLYDSSLKKPKFKGKFTLINQKDASKSITQVEEGTEDHSYPYLGLTIAKPSNLSEFLVNDELMYEASIEILDLST